MKRIIIVALFMVNATIGNAQNTQTETAQQDVQINLTNTIEIAFSSNNTPTGNTVSLPFSSMNDYANGVESAPQELYVSSNKHFTVTVHTLNPYFTITNNGVTTTSSMPSSVLTMMIATNNTGGNLGQNFSSTNYNSLTQTPTSLITDANNGYLEKFAIKYKAVPGFTYPSGIYANDVVFTATQQ